MSTASVSEPMPRTLANQSVLVTRPEHKQAGLCQRLIKLKATPITLPTIDIEPVTEQNSEFGILKQSILDLDLFDIVICISANAARLAGELIDQYWPQLPINIQWYAIGNSTANTLRKYDIEAQVPSAASDSEALLSEPALQSLSTKRVLILKGYAGRKRLTETLLNRGANVTEAILYNRRIPVYTDSHVSQRLYKLNLSAILVTSAEALQNLTTIAQGSKLQFNHKVLQDTDLIVPSTRVAQIAETQGYFRITVAAAADDESMLAALLSVNGWDADDEKN